MKPAVRRIALPSGLAALAAGLASAWVLGAAGQVHDPPGPAAGPSALSRTLDAVVLLRWGHGAVHWMLPDTRGEPHGREPPDHRR